MKLRNIILLVILGLLAASLSWYAIKPELNKPRGGALLQSVIKEGKPLMRWYQTKEGFHFLYVFDGQYVAHGTSLFLGAIGPDSWVKIKCAPINDYKCNSAELLGFKNPDPKQQQPHQH